MGLYCVLCDMCDIVCVCVCVCGVERERERESLRRRLIMKLNAYGLDDSRWPGLSLSLLDTQCNTDNVPL